MRVAEERPDNRFERVVLQVVEVGEDRHLRELAHARDEEEALLPLQCLQYGVERLERVLELRHLRRHEMPQERLVVFVDQDDHLAFVRLRRNSALFHRGLPSRRRRQII